VYQFIQQLVQVEDGADARGDRLKGQETPVLLLQRFLQYLAADRSTGLFHR